MKLSMTSQEVADLTGKDHDNVLRDVRNMANQLQVEIPSELRKTPGKAGRPSTVFILDRDLTMTLVTGYDVAMRHRVMKRWRELEEKEAGAPLSITDMLKQAAAKIEEQEQQIRDRALRGVMVTPTVLVTEFCVRAGIKRVRGSKGAMYINQRLENAGLQVRGRNARGQNVYTPTAAGEMYSMAVTDVGLKWDLAVVDILLEDDPV